MDIRNDERHRCNTLIFHPVRARAEFSKNLTGPKFFCLSIVVVIGQDPGEDINLTSAVASRRSGNLRASLQL
jgi:hypothetical protein